MATVQKSIDVKVPVHTAYNQWTQFEEFPRFMEGVVRLTKLHGSLDWFFDKDERRIHRKGIPFGAPADHSDVPKHPLTSARRDFWTFHWGSL